MSLFCSFCSVTWPSLLYTQRSSNVFFLSYFSEKICNPGKNQLWPIGHHSFSTRFTETAAHQKPSWLLETVCCQSSWCMGVCQPGNITFISLLGLPEQVSSRMEEEESDIAHSLRVDPDRTQSDWIFHTDLSASSSLGPTETAKPQPNSLQTIVASFRVQ